MREVKSKTDIVTRKLEKEGELYQAQINYYCLIMKERHTFTIQCSYSSAIIDTSCIAAALFRTST